jgi:hypothetical protein
LRTLPELTRVEPYIVLFLKDGAPSLLTNIRLGIKRPMLTNTLAYYSKRVHYTKKVLKLWSLIEIQETFRKNVISRNYDTQYRTLSVMTLVITALSIMTLSAATLSITAIRIMTLSIIITNIITPSKRFKIETQFNN